MHYYTGKDTDTDTRRERENFSEFSLSSRVHRVSRAREFRSLAWLPSKLLTVDERNGIRFTRRIFARGVVELIAPGFLNQTMYVDIKFLLFSPSLLLLLSIMASCVETFEMQVMDLRLLTVLRAFFVT